MMAGRSLTRYAYSSIRLGKSLRRSAMGLRKSCNFCNRTDSTRLVFFRALVGAVRADGKSIFAGKSFTGFSNTEEEIGGGGKVSGIRMEEGPRSIDL